MWQYGKFCLSAPGSTPYDHTPRSRPRSHGIIPIYVKIQEGYWNLYTRYLVKNVMQAVLDVQQEVEPQDQN